MLVGTQMVAKGHDFPDVTLGVVLDADQTLRFPDFRAEERTFALVAQLAGRAGARATGTAACSCRRSSPDAPSIVAAARHDADGFLAGELERRRALAYPPFASLIRVICSAEEADDAAAAAQAVRERIAGGRDAVVLGPAPLFRLRGRERSQLVVKATRRRGDRRRRGGRGRRRENARRAPRAAQRGRRPAVAPAGLAAMADETRTVADEDARARRRGGAAARSRGRCAPPGGAAASCASWAIRC